MAKSILKPALYYAFRSGWFRGLGYKPVAVTSIKGNRLWYGRECGDNIATHGHVHELKGRFKSEEEAMAVLEGLRAITEKYAPLLEANEKERRDLYNAQTSEERVYLATPKED